MRKMNVWLFSVLLIIFTQNLILCNQPKNLEELEDSEDWEGITDAICKENHSNDIKAQVEKCNLLEPEYKFQTLMKKCEKLRAPEGSAWYDEQKGECKYNECYIKLSKTKEFENLRKETDNVDEEALVKKGYERYKCIRKALGLKV